MPSAVLRNWPNLKQMEEFLNDLSHLCLYIYYKLTLKDLSSLFCLYWLTLFTNYNKNQTLMHIATANSRLQKEPKFSQVHTPHSIINKKRPKYQLISQTKANFFSQQHISHSS